jgi:predicted DNA-binding transcriptional regulator YafY
MKNRYPTPEELYALEHEARRLRAAEMARLARKAADAVRSLFARIVTVRNAKGWKHA